MITQTRNCDGCGEKIESSDVNVLSNVTEERRKELFRNGSMFTHVSLVLTGETNGEHAGRCVEQYGNARFDICPKCAETRTIASFKIPKPAT